MSAKDEKYQIGTDSGNILWDVAALRKSLGKANYKVISMNVKDLASCNSFNGNFDYAMETDISIPCIVVELCDGKLEEV